MNNKELAFQIIKYVGGKQNIENAIHCISRLRLYLKDESKINKGKLDELAGVHGTTKHGEQFQIIVGNEVTDVCNEVRKQVGLMDESPSRVTGQKVKRKYKIQDIFGLFAETISGIFVPILDPICGAGLICGVYSLLGALQVFDANSDIMKYLSVLAFASFYFMPLLLAYSAAKKFDCNPFTALITVGILIHPTIMEYATNGQALHLLGLTIEVIKYTSTVLPAIITVYALAKLEHLLKMFIPKSFWGILIPAIGLLIVPFLALLLIGPFCTGVSDIIGKCFIFLFDKMPLVAYPLKTVLTLFFTMFGIHLAFTAIGLDMITATGKNLLIAQTAAMNMAMAGAALALLIVTKNRKAKETASSGILTSVIGLSEPAIYSIMLRYTKLFPGFIVGCIAGGLVHGLGKVWAYGIGLVPLGALPIFFNDTFGWFAVGCIVSFVATFVICYLTIKNDKKIISVDDENHETSGTEEKVPAEKKHFTKQNIYSPVNGKVIEMKDVKDEMFASGMIGQGYAVIPTEGKVVSPVNGIVVTVFTTGHALGLRTPDGLEILIHIGIDTVQLEGKHFKPLVKEGQIIEIGDALVIFEKDAVVNDGYDVTTSILIANLEESNTIFSEQIGKEIAAGDILCTVA